MTRPALCVLSAANLRHNFQTIKARAPRSKIMAMVKANAYGHGLTGVARHLEGVADSFGVACLDEAVSLRQAGLKTPITLIEGVYSAQEITLAAQLECAVVFHSAHQIDWLDAAVVSRPLTAWVKLDTGMGRLGFSADQILAAWQRLSSHKAVGGPVGVVSHFACADTPDHPLNRQQIAAFDAFAPAGLGPRSLCNSAGIFAFPDCHHDCVRPGLALYGASPLEGIEASALGLRPVMQMQTEIIARKTMPRGASISYGATYLCPEDMPVGILAIGYGDGYPRLAGARGKTAVLVNGALCPVLGRVAMDMTAIDLRPCPLAQVGDTAVLWGQDLPVDRVASACGVSPYDLLTGYQSRVKSVWRA